MNNVLLQVIMASILIICSMIMGGYMMLQGHTIRNQQAELQELRLECSHE